MTHAGDVKHGLSPAELTAPIRRRRTTGARLRLRSFFKEFFRLRGRDFPWRKEGTSEFSLVLAEVLLRQTRAETVPIVWGRIGRSYTTFPALARASRRELERELRPLGLHKQRARALIELAQSVNQDRLPTSTVALSRVPHLGLYATAALLCFSRERRVPVVDTNVMRILGRYLGRRFGNDIRRAQEAWWLAWDILPTRNIKQHNYGLLDFGALVCTARKPSCPTCGLRHSCEFVRSRPSE